MARELEQKDSLIGGIDIQQTKLMMAAEDKIDKEEHRKKIKAKHREERLKAKAERRLASQENKEEDGEEGDDDDEGEYTDDSTADIIDALPDPDKIYGPKSDQDDAEFYSGPSVVRCVFITHLLLII